MRSIKTATDGALRALALVSFVVAMLCLAPGNAWALGQKEAPREPATGLTDWEHDFEAEMQAIVSPKVRRMIADKAVKVVNYRDLK